MPSEKKSNHIHIPASAERVKSKEIKERHKKRKQNGKPEKVTNEMIYEILMDIMDKQEVLEMKLKNLS